MQTTNEEEEISSPARKPMSLDATAVQTSNLYHTSETKEAETEPGISVRATNPKTEIVATESWISDRTKLPRSRDEAYTRMPPDETPRNRGVTTEVLIGSE